MFKKSLVLSLCALTACASFANERGGSGPGNGGGAAGCFDNGILKHAEFYDFVEARDNGLDIPQETNLTTDQHLLDVYQRILSYNRALAYTFLRLMPVVYHPVKKDGYLNEIGDSKHLYMPLSVCKKSGGMKPEFIQLANYKDSPNGKTSDDVLYISNPAYEALSSIDQAGVYVHEIVYKWYRSSLSGHYDYTVYRFVYDEAPQDSTQARELTALLFAKNLNEAQLKRLQQLLSSLATKYGFRSYGKLWLWADSTTPLKERLSELKEMSFRLNDQSVLDLPKGSVSALVNERAFSLYQGKNAFSNVRDDGKFKRNLSASVILGGILTPLLGTGTVFLANEIQGFSYIKVAALIKQAEICFSTTECEGKQLKQLYDDRSEEDQELSIMKYSEKILDFMTNGGFIKKEGRVKHKKRPDAHRKNPKLYRYNKIKNFINN